MGSSRGRQRPPRCTGDGGAGLVEFALIAPLLFMLIFGIIDFGWAFYQSSDVRHGARETARLAAVNYNPDGETVGTEQAADIINEGCERMDDGSDATITLSLPDGEQLGAKAVVEVSKPLDSLTGFFNSVLPDDLEDTVAIRLEQTAEWDEWTLGC